MRICMNPLSILDGLKMADPNKAIMEAHLSYDQRVLAAERDDNLIVLLRLERSCIKEAFPCDDECLVVSLTSKFVPEGL